MGGKFSLISEITEQNCPCCTYVGNRDNDYYDDRPHVKYYNPTQREKYGFTWVIVFISHARLIYIS